MTIPDKVEMCAEIEKIIDRYYREELKPLRFKNQAAEDNVWYEIESMCEDIEDLISERAKRIGYEIEDSIVKEESRDMESFIYNCQL